MPWEIETPQTAQPAASGWLVEQPDGTLTPAEPKKPVGPLAGFGRSLMGYAAQGADLALKLPAGAMALSPRGGSTLADAYFNAIKPALDVTSNAREHWAIKPDEELTGPGKIGSALGSATGGIVTAMATGGAAPAAAGGGAIGAALPALPAAVRAALQYGPGVVRGMTSAAVPFGVIPAAGEFERLEAAGVPREQAGNAALTLGAGQTAMAGLPLALGGSRLVRAATAPLIAVPTAEATIAAERAVLEGQPEQVKPKQFDRENIAANTIVSSILGAMFKGGAVDQSRIRPPRIRTPAPDAPPPADAGGPPPAPVAPTHPQYEIYKPFLDAMGITDPTSPRVDVAIRSIEESRAAKQEWRQHAGADGQDVAGVRAAEEAIAEGEADPASGPWVGADRTPPNEFMVFNGRTLVDARDTGTLAAIDRIPPATPEELQAVATRHGMTVERLTSLPLETYHRLLLGSRMEAHPQPGPLALPQRGAARPVGDAGTDAAMAALRPTPAEAETIARQLGVTPEELPQLSADLVARSVARLRAEQQPTPKPLELQQRGSAVPVGDAGLDAAMARSEPTADEAVTIARQFGVTPDELSRLPADVVAQAVERLRAEPRPNAGAAFRMAAPPDDQIAGAYDAAEAPNVPGNRPPYRFGDAENQRGRRLMTDAEVGEVEVTQASKRANAQRNAAMAELDGVREQIDRIDSNPDYNDMRLRAEAGERGPHMETFNKIQEQRGRLAARQAQLESIIYKLAGEAQPGTVGAMGGSGRPFRADDTGLDTAETPAGGAFQGKKPPQTPDEQARFFEEQARAKADADLQAGIDKLEQEWRARERIRAEREKGRRPPPGKDERTPDPTTFGTKPRPQDPKSGLWHIDGDGFVISDKGGPLYFKHQRDAGRWILSTGQKLSPRESFQIANHPGGKGFTVQRTVLKPDAKRPPAGASPKPDPKGKGKKQAPAEKKSAEPAPEPVAPEPPKAAETGTPESVVGKRVTVDVEIEGGGKGRIEVDAGLELRRLDYRARALQALKDCLQA